MFGTVFEGGQPSMKYGFLSEKDETECFDA